MPLASLAYALGGLLTLLILALEIRKIRINHSDSVLPAAALGLYADGDPSARRNRGRFPGACREAGRTRYLGRNTCPPLCAALTTSAIEVGESATVS